MRLTRGASGPRLEAVKGKGPTRMGRLNALTAVCVEGFEVYVINSIIFLVVCIYV